MPASLLYGLAIGLAQLLATLAVYAFGLHGSAEGLAKAQMPESLTGFVLLMLVLGYAHRSAKKAAAAQGKEFTFGSAAKLFGLVALLGGVFTGLGQWLYVTAVNPRLLELQRAEIMTRAAAEIAKLAPEDAAKVQQQIEFATSAGMRAALYGFNTLFFALLLGLAYALIFRAAARRDAAPRAR